MKAVVYKGPRRVAVEEVPDPRIEASTDAIVRITSTAICGSDLHMYDGCTVVGPGTVIGHEPMGVVEEVGPGVQTIRKGDRVVMPFNISCGFCYNCVRGYPHACLTANPDAAGAAYGYVGMGPYSGGQAEYLRVPYADYDCLKLPGQPGDDLEDDFVLLADIFPTAFHATELAGVRAGMTVAIYGAGPVGLLATQSALLRGASQVFTVDDVPERLDLVRKIGGTPIDASKASPVDQIRALRQGQKERFPGEEKMPGVMCGIDAVGYQAREKPGSGEEQSNRVLEELIELVNPTGQIGVIGVYVPSNPCGQTDATKRGVLDLSFGKLWSKGISIGTGQAPVARYNRQLRDLIVAGRAKPSVIVSHRLPLDVAPAAYDKFDRRVEGYTKVVLRPGQRRS